MKQAEAKESESAKGKKKFVFSEWHKINVASEVGPISFLQICLGTGKLFQKLKIHIGCEFVRSNHLLILFVRSINFF
jgi:hypothetical protein